MTERSYRISVDCGGTFTDGILLSDAHEVWAAKTDSTPVDPKVGVVECISRLAAQVGLGLAELLATTKTIVLGTTLATNIVATRTGAKTGAIVTRGYRDRLSFLHVAKSDLGGDRKASAAELFSFRSEFPQPLVPRHLVTEVDERLDFTGEVLIPPLRHRRLRGRVHLQDALAGRPALLPRHRLAAQTPLRHSAGPRRAAFPRVARGDNPLVRSLAERHR